MIRTLIHISAAIVFITGASRAEVPAGAENAPESQAVTPAPAAAVPVPATPGAQALRAALASLPPGRDDEERNEYAALASFYEARAWQPLWLTPAGALTPRASAAMGEIRRADEWGLDPRDFPLPAPTESGRPDAIVAAETGISLAILKYGRHARGGRIINPAEQLSSYLDRRPQLLKPAAILEDVAAAGQPDAYLRGLHPRHPQFEKLRQRYLTLRNGAAGKGKGLAGMSAEAKRLLANMEAWRWMPVDLGEVYIWNNIPDFTQRVVINGAVVRTERIVAGETGKQTPIFSRPLRNVTFKPAWKVPDSIKVRELWPSLLRGGGLMREWALEVRTKEGELRDWRRMNWAATDIRKYDVVQPNGPKSVMGQVKFSFPNQHTVFMHDSLKRDGWMFRKARRTYSHGCMRVANPIGLAEVVLREDKGWDAAKVREVLHMEPDNNEIALERKIFVHMTYFTVLAGEDGKLRTFPDVYGHERRIVLALEGKWRQIDKGRDHLAPVELNLSNATRAGDGNRRRGTGSGSSSFVEILSGIGGF